MDNAALPAEVKGKLRRRFYEAIVFLSALTTTFENNRRSVAQDQGSTRDSPSESKFKTFVNTLSQFCDVKPGGDTVTAVSVLDLQDRIQYRFACNKVNDGALKKVKDFITKLLNLVRDGGPSDNLRKELLSLVLPHCRVRVCCYLTAFKKACKECIATKPADARHLDELIDFQKAVPDVSSKNEDVHTFAQEFQELVDLIEQSHRHPEGSVLAERTAQSSMSQTKSCWSELRHHAGRLKSYSVGVRTLMTTAKTFPKLVESGFEVVPIPSSIPDSNPIPAKETTAQDILGRMCRTREKQLPYEELLDGMKSVDINKIIKDIIWKDSFRPIVHAELLVLQSLEKADLEHPSNFFNAWKYIGSSKPTCRLCHYYFQARNGGFQVRSTHENLYINWKPPDVLRPDHVAIKKRETIMNAMVGPIREDGLRTLKERVPLGRDHDSSTGMTFPTVLSPLAEQLAVEADMETSFGDSDVEV